MQLGHGLLGTVRFFIGNPLRSSGRAQKTHVSPSDWYRIGYNCSGTAAVQKMMLNPPETA